MRTVLLVILSLLCSSIFWKGCEKKIDTGVIELRFKKDTIGYQQYWLIDHSFNEEYFVFDIGDYIGQLSLLCPSFNFSVPKDRIRLYDLQIVTLDTIKQGIIINDHLNSKIYKTGNDEIILCYNVKAEFIYLKSPPCDGFSFSSSYICPVERTVESYPLKVLVNIIDIEHVSEDYLKAKGYKLSKEAFFSIDYCN